MELILLVTVVLCVLIAIIADFLRQRKIANDKVRREKERIEEEDRARRWQEIVSASKTTELPEDVSPDEFRRWEMTRPSTEVYKLYVPPLAGWDARSHIYTYHTVVASGMYNPSFSPTASPTKVCSFCGRISTGTQEECPKCGAPYERKELL